MSASKLTDTIRDSIAKLVEQNLTLSAAAQSVGIGKSTASLWYKWGREAEKGKYRQFYEAVNEAHDRASQRLLDKVQSLAEHGDQVTRGKIVYHPDGTRTETTEIQTSQNFAVLKWLLEKRHNYDSGPEKAAERTVNRLIAIARKHLPEELFFELVAAIADDPILGDVDFDKDLLITK